MCFGESIVQTKYSTKYVRLFTTDVLPFDTKLVLSVLSSNSDIIEETEAHGCGALGMVSWWSERDTAKCYILHTYNIRLSFSVGESVNIDGRSEGSSQECLTKPTVTVNIC